MTEANLTKARHELVQTVKPFVSRAQLSVLADLLRGSERFHWAERVCTLADTIKSMPSVYGQDGLGDDAIVYLHYFNGGIDAWITEKDSTPEQLQAFGLVDLGCGAEFGYVSIEELKANCFELNFYWTPKKIKDCPIQNW